MQIVLLLVALCYLLLLDFRRREQEMAELSESVEVVLEQGNAQPDNSPHFDGASFLNSVDKIFAEVRLRSLARISH